MDLRQMRLFVAVAEELHFGKAARRLGMAQPPLSQAIRRLEQDFGVKLFDRSRRAVELTEVGRIFLEEARRTLKQANIAREMVRRAAEASMEVRVSFIGPALYRFLPKLILKYREELADGTAVRLLERPSEAQIDGILSGQLDVGFVSVVTDHAEGLESMVVERSGRCAAAPANWGIAKQDSVKLADLVEYPFIMPPQKYAPYYSETLSIFKELGMMPRVAQESAQTNTTLSLVDAGLGWSIVMNHASRVQFQNVKFMRIEEQRASRPWELTMIWSSERLNPASRKFLLAAKRYLAENPQLKEMEQADRAR